jgi:hypothetical protein
MVYTLEDYLVRLHRGQWFGWTDSKNKVYANLVIHSEDAKPTEQECTDGVASLQAEYDSQEYARNRATEYPSIGDQLDMIFHAGLGGDEFQSAIQAVKDAHPKGGN